MSSADKGSSRVEHERRVLREAAGRGRIATFGAWLKLSGPGWLQSAITIGGGSLSNSLYLGVLVGFAFLWVQPVAMILGVAMLAAISYVALSTGERPLKAINEHVSPVLGWSWVLASIAANMVWSMPQYALAAGALQQNLFPGFFGPGFGGTLGAALIVMAVAIGNVMLYNHGGAGVKIFETIIKLLIGSIVLCFVGVVFKLFLGGAVTWPAVGAGLIPDFSLLFEPSDRLAALIERVDPAVRAFWSEFTVAKQRDTMTGAAATAVGINMTFLLPYSMLRKGWNHEFRHLAVFDLATGLVIPFALATGCIVIASASQFHGETERGLVEGVDVERYVESPAYQRLAGRYWTLLDRRIQWEAGESATAGLQAARAELVDLTRARERGEAGAAAVGSALDRVNGLYAGRLERADRVYAATIVDRDSFNLAEALAPLLGEGPSKVIFGFGIVAMALNAATMLMLINGLCLCELLGRPARGKTQLAGSLMPALAVLVLLRWRGAMMWLAVPTSVFCATLLPIAYLAFLLLINQRRLMGDRMPTDPARAIWNVLMAAAVLASGALSVFNLNGKLGAPWGYIIFAVFGLLILVVGRPHLKRARDAE
ncbi:divalent metal cation transporter [Kiritimatiella glycovorans]|uniref:Mn2+ and Fe2+ transporters of the NRAMP family protein n=1 Tax=Kiritimatiella glycovorans TaxID=1307763 RepID=A0A0G3EH83_9BACT|nr:divalent metal cation transporter [Kiritimatiella glycovorans]AKJ63504.1 Mn2+ and Fe2+ transporters of the NRAMP family protein [Kiritimatiella glycovorans]